MDDVSLEGIGTGIQNRETTYDIHFEADLRLTLCDNKLSLKFCSAKVAVLFSADSICLHVSKNLFSLVLIAFC